MNIRFTSSLTPEDENEIAPAILETVGRILDLLPIAYMLRIDTTDAKSFQLSGPGPKSAGGPSRRFQSSELPQNVD